MKNFFQKYRFFIILFLFALLLRVVLFSVNFTVNDHQLIPTIKGDDGYYELSQNILLGNGFSFDAEPPFRPNPLRPPLWPYIIAGLASVGGYPLVFVCELLMASSIPILGVLISRYFVTEKISRYVGYFMAMSPYTILLSFLLYTETSFTFFFLCFVLFLFRYIRHKTLRAIIWASVFLGLSILIKPTVQYFIFLVPLGLLFIERKRLSKIVCLHVLLFALFASLVVMPWLYRNKQEFGVWGMSAQPAFNAYVYIVPTLLAIDNNTDFATELNSFVYKDGFDPNTITLENAQGYTDKAFEIIREHKSALIQSALITLVTFFTHDGVLTILGNMDIRLENVVVKPVITLLAHPGELFSAISHYVYGPAFFIILMRLFWYVCALFFCVGAWLLLRKEEVRPYVITALCMVLYFAVTTAINGFGVNARFRVPVEVFIGSFALYGLISVLRTILLKLQKPQKLI